MTKPTPKDDSAFTTWVDDAGTVVTTFDPSRVVQVSDSQAIDKRVKAALKLHRTATPRHSMCVTCGSTWPCPTYNTLVGGDDV
jgi:hypothetical protein